MLAERRKKVIYSNPRGLLWANDEQKFGKRMLESMGWKNGKGLGKNEDGITENVKANFKFDSKGFGYKQKLNDWIEENNVYEQLLSDLAQHHGNSQQAGLSNGSPNKAAKPKAGRRIPRSSHKFIKAKNLSVQSEKDLFCIFPTTKETSDLPANSSDCQPDSAQAESTNKELKAESEPQVSQLVTVESKLSIQDYFKQKMQTKLSGTNANSCPAESTFGQLSCETDESGHSVKSKHKHKKRKHA